MRIATMTGAALLLLAGPSLADPRILLATADPLDPCVTISDCGVLTASAPDTGTFVLRVILNDIGGNQNAVTHFGIQMPTSYAIESEDFCDAFGILDEDPARGLVLIALQFGHAITHPTQTLVAFRIHASEPGAITIVPAPDNGQTRVTLDGVPHDIQSTQLGTLRVGSAGTLPCVDVVPVAATTWSLLKRLYAR